jgi:two-component system, chemotaxis family, protein-glutamate methylesterase/glutaminase
MSIRVLIVDDSATAREVLTNALKKDKEIEIVGTAPDAYIARDKIVTLKPDIICLDVEMPRMDGITFLKKIMKFMPVPVLMVSSLTQKGAKVTLDALEAGAVDFVAKPHQNIYDGIDDIEKELIAKVKMVASSNIKARITKRINPIEQIIEKKYSLANTTNKIITIGASTGGTVALAELIKALPRDIPGVVIVQHMPAGFTDSFAKRLNEISQVEVSEAKDGDIISKGKVLIAPGDYHMVIRREGGQYKVKLGTGEKVSGHRPSVDVLFNSVSKYAGANAVGVILTGMGSDGAKGLLKMRNSGSRTIGQNEKSCVVYGMPKVANDIGAVEMELPLEQINDKIISFLNHMEK